MKAAIFTTLALGLSVGTAQAVTYEYQLADFPNGGASANYDYGLRLDREEPKARFFSFSNGDGATLTYDDEAGTAEISGTVRESMFGKFDGSLFNISYTMSGLTDLGGGSFLDFAGNGSGTISNPWDSLSFGAAANTSGLYLVFAVDDANVPDYGQSLGGAHVGHGWVQKGPGSNDFLFTATPTVAPVPLPAAGWMLIAGIGGLSAMRRGRKKA